MNCPNGETVEAKGSHLFTYRKLGVITFTGVDETSGFGANGNFLPTGRYSKQSE